MIIWMVGGSAALHGLQLRRSGSLLILLALTWVLSQGRLHTQSLMVGLGVGWFAGISHAVITRDESTYDGRITGYLGDPNGAGFVILTVGCVLIAYAGSAGRRTWPIFLVMTAGVLLTLSRTTLFALGAAVLWAHFAPRLGRWTSLLVLALSWPVYHWLVGAAQEKGFFAERAGSDALRQRLAVIESQMTDSAGWAGLGLGTAQAKVDNVTLWFHNSFLALWVEGGLIAFLLFAAGLVTLFWTLHRVPGRRREPWLEAALVAALLCSVNIGFSLTSVPTAIALGMYLLSWRRSVEDFRDVPVPLGEASERRHS
jgi:hypothetical protein